ncbi:hypothetical protein M0R36_06845 [bacterium]|nr:hypothetical protein [bacterium]
MIDRTVLIRTDAGASIGFGHIARCICIAKKLAEKKYTPVFILKDKNRYVTDMLKRMKFGCCYIGKKEALEKEAVEVKNIILRKKAAACIFDSYNLNENYFLKLEDTSAPLILIDDRNYLKFPEVGVIVNGNLFAEDLKYSISKTTKLYLGAEYFIMDEAFRTSGLQGILKRKTSAGMCLSSVKFEVLLKLASFLCSVNFDNLNIVLTALQKKHYKELLKYFRGFKNVKLYFNLDAEGFSSVMKKNMFFFTTGGTMMCQSLCSGCITYAYPVNKYQEKNVLHAEKKKLAKKISLKQVCMAEIREDIAYLSNLKNKRACIVKKAMKTIDGKGLCRVTDIILESIDGKNKIN